MKKIKATLLKNLVIATSVTYFMHQVCLYEFSTAKLMRLFQETVNFPVNDTRLEDLQCSPHAKGWFHQKQADEGNRTLLTLAILSAFPTVTAADQVLKDRQQTEQVLTSEGLHNRSFQLTCTYSRILRVLSFIVTQLAKGTSAFSRF